MSVKTATFFLFLHLLILICFICLHVTLSPVSSFFSPTISMSSVTTSTFSPQHISKPSPPNLLNIISKLLHLNSPSDLLISNAVHPGHFQWKTQHLYFCHVYLSLLSKPYITADLTTVLWTFSLKFTGILWSKITKLLCPSIAPTPSVCAPSVSLAIYIF